MRPRNYLTVCLNTGWQPHHWLMPAAVGSRHLVPVCGQARDKDAPQINRLLDRSKAGKLACEACRRAFSEQLRKGRKGIK